MKAVLVTTQHRGTLRNRDGEAVIERGRVEPLPARPDLPAFLQRQA